ncbi:caspase b-like [Chanodichthys erythropterus]|uniref:caspase b-like n=1 Tax=Chanodichthys erythropterus TaxID=933992 RepID=UPI00351E8693
MASVKELLEKSLNELEEAELKKFQWHLRNDHESISKSDMENADRLKTVDKMVECFGPEEAVKITVEILRKINQNDLAEHLENKHKQDPLFPWTPFPRILLFSSPAHTSLVSSSSSQITCTWTLLSALPIYCTHSLHSSSVLCFVKMYVWCSLLSVE